jgi:hypothetical protein
MDLVAERQKITSYCKIKKKKTLYWVGQLP